MPRRRSGAQRAVERGGPTAPRRKIPRAEATQPFEPGRAEPPLPITDDLEEFVAPPRHGKVHPPEEMDEATPCLDDEVRRYRHHPSDAGSTEFSVDPDAGDAAADLAGDLGSAFLEGATRGEDLGDLAMAMEERTENDLPLVLDEEGEEVVDDGLETAAESVTRARPAEPPGALGEDTARRARPADERVHPDRKPRRRR